MPNMYEEIENLQKELTEIAIIISDASTRLNRLCYRTKFWEIAEELYKKAKESESQNPI